ncbi:MAG: DUF502 domain-containing protein [Candidatus Binatia bacterium]
MAEQPKKRVRGRVREGLRRYFFAGLLLFLPLVITLWFLGWIIGLMDGLLDFFPSSLRPDSYLPFAIPGLGALFTLGLILLLGFFATSVITQRLLAAWEDLLSRIPIFRGIYTAVRKLVESIFSQEQGGRQVILIEYPRKGIYTIGIAMGQAWSELEERSEERLVNVFVPTTPNPTSGFYLLVPEKEVVPLAMTLEEAFKLIASGGMIMPEEKSKVASR